MNKKMATLIKSPQQYYSYLDTTNRMKRHFSPELRGYNPLNSINQELMERFIEISEISKQFSSNFYLRTKESVRMKRQNEFRAENLNERLKKFKAEKQEKIQKIRHHENITKKLQKMDQKLAFKVLYSKFSSGYGWSRRDIERFLVKELITKNNEKHIAIDSIEVNGFIDTMVNIFIDYSRKMSQNAELNFKKRNELERKKELVKKAYATKKLETAPSGNEIIQKMIKVAESLTTETVKKHFFGSDCNPNLKVVARESDKPTLDSTCNHNYSLNELQEISTLVKWLQKQKSPLKHEIMDYSNIGDGDFFERIAPDNGSSCHKEYGAYSESAPFLLDNGVKVLRLIFDHNKFIRFYYLEMNKGVAQSDAYYFTASGKTAVNAGLMTFTMLAELANQATNNPFNAYIESNGNDEIYINSFETFVGYPEGNIELIADNDNYLSCIYSEDAINPDSDYYLNCQELLDSIDSNLNLTISSDDYSESYVLESNASAWLDELDINDCFESEINDIIHNERR